MIDEFTILIILGAIFVTILVVIIIRVISLIPNKIKKDNEIDNNENSSFFGSSDNGKIEKLKINKIGLNTGYSTNNKSYQDSDLYHKFNKISTANTSDSNKTVKFLDMTSLNQHSKQIVNLNSMMNQSRKEESKDISIKPEILENQDLELDLDTPIIESLESELIIKENYVPAPILSMDILHITSGICLWIDSQDKFNLYQDLDKEIDITSSNQKIAYITDKSIYNNNLTQALPNKRPIYIENQEGVVSGIKFLGDNYLEGTFPLEKSDEYTIVFVGVNSLKSSIWPGIFTTKPSGSSEANIKQGFAIFGEKDSYKVNFESGDTVLNTFDDNNPNIGILIGNSNYNEGNNIYKVGNWIGLDQAFEGIVCEIIVYNRKLDKKEILSVQTYLENKWKN